jgi:hypothetical protein
MLSLIPTLGCCGFGDLFPRLRRHAFRARLSAHPAQLLGKLPSASEHGGRRDHQPLQAPSSTGVAPQSAGGNVTGAAVLTTALTAKRDLPVELRRVDAIGARGALTGSPPLFIAIQAAVAEKQVEISLLVRTRVGDDICVR